MARGAGRLARQSGAVQSRKQEVAAAITRKHAPRAVGSVRRRGQADDPDPRLRITKPRHGFSPVIPLDKRPAFFARDVATVFAQPRAPRTRDDLTMELYQRSDRRSRRR